MQEEKTAAANLGYFRRQGCRNRSGQPALSIPRAQGLLEHVRMNTRHPQDSTARNAAQAGEAQSPRTLGGCMKKGRTAAASQGPRQLPSPHLLAKGLGVDLAESPKSTRTLPASQTPASDEPQAHCLCIDRMAARLQEPLRPACLEHSQGPGAAGTRSYEHQAPTR